MKLRTFFTSLALTLLACGPAAAEMTLHYDFINTPSLVAEVGPTLSFTRATKAAMTDADGYIREVQPGEARFTGTTFNHNLFLQSNNFDTTWTRQNVAAPTGGQSDPDGGSNAWLLVDDSGGGTARIGVYQTISFTGPRAMVAFKAKANGLSYAAVEYDFFGSPATNSFTFFNLTDGTTNAASGTTAGTVDLGGGWYWCYTYFDARTSNIGDISIRPSSGAGVTEDRDGTSSIYIYQAQAGGVSTSVSTPNTYIPTTTVAKTSLTGTSTKGLLVEEARTNVCFQSEDFSTTWTTTGLTVTTNSTVAPDGSTTADTLDDPDASFRSADGNSSAYTAGDTYTGSVFIKKDAVAPATRYPQFRVDFTGGTGKNLSIALDTSTGNTDTSNSTGTVVDSGVEEYVIGSDTYYRLWISGNDGNNANTLVRLRLFPAIGANSDLTTLSAAATGSVIAWGAQLEAGAFPTSYIGPVLAASVTRNADQVSATVTGVVNDTGYGSLYSSHTLLGVAGGTTDDPGVWTLKDGISRIQLYYINSSLANLGVSSFNTTGDEITVAGGFATDSVVGVEQKHVVGIAEDDVATYKNGEAGNTDSTYDGHVLSADWVLHLGFADVGSFYLNGHIAEIRYYDERYPNAILLDISLGTFPVTGKPVKAIMPGLSIGATNETSCFDDTAFNADACVAGTGGKLYDLGVFRARQRQSREGYSAGEGAWSSAEGDLYDLDRVVGF